MVITEVDMPEQFSMQSLPVLPLCGSLWDLVITETGGQSKVLPVILTTSFSMKNCNKSYSFSP